MATEIRLAIARGVAFIETVQLPSGEIPVLASNDSTLATATSPDPSVFPTAVAAQALAACPEADGVRQRACAFLLSERNPAGLWRHWTRHHPQAGNLPPDLDDSSCAAAALQSCRIVTGNRSVLLANRRRDGLFLTWVIPRLRWMGLAHARAILPRLAHLPTLFFFFRATSAAPADVDAVVNANCLFYLRDFDRRQAVVDHLCAVLREGREAQCDKWYENVFAVRYFLSRALRGARADAADLFRRSEPVAANALETAFALNVALDWNNDLEMKLIDSLLALQNSDGSWPRAALYHGGRERLPDRSFAPRHPDTPHWGSEALTTAFCLEALARGNRMVAG